MEASAPPRPRAIARSPDRLRTSGDAELVRLVRLGHEPAFEEIYDRHHRGILSFCRHMLRSREEAEDAVQHTFIAAYKDLRASDKPIHLKAWLYTIARNRCLSTLRARREQVSIDDVEPSTEGLAAEVQRREDLRDMLRDLHGLPDEQREALVLSELGALSHEEIAMTLGVRKDKVKALVFQARESLSSSRTARDTDCDEIQKQLSVLRGGALRRTTLRRHLEGCPGCQAFRAEVQRQRAALAVILPVAPTAGLKAGVIAGAVGATATAGAGGAAAGGILFGANGLATKLIVGAALVGAGAGGGMVAIDELRSPPWSSADDLEQEISLAGDGTGSAAVRQRAAAGKPADGDAHFVVASLRERARTVAVQRDTDRRVRLGRPVFGAAIGGKRTGPDPALVVPIVIGALPGGHADAPGNGGDAGKDGAGGKGGGSTAGSHEPGGDDGHGSKKPKRAKKPKIHQGLGAQQKGHGYGRGRKGSNGAPSSGSAGTGDRSPGPSSSSGDKAKPSRPARSHRRDDDERRPSSSGRSRGDDRSGSRRTETPEPKADRVPKVKAPAPPPQGGGDKDDDHGRAGGRDDDGGDSGKGGRPDDVDGGDDGRKDPKGYVFEAATTSTLPSLIAVLGVA